MVHNLLSSVTAYLDLALIFLLFRFSLRIRFFLHCNNIITYLVMLGKKFWIPNELWSSSPGSFCCPQIMWRSVQSESMENCKVNKLFPNYENMISLYLEMKINIRTLLNFLIRFPHYANIITVTCYCPQATTFITNPHIHV